MHRLLPRLTARKGSARACSNAGGNWLGEVTRLSMSVETTQENKGGAKESDLFDKYNAQGLALFKENKFADAILLFRQALQLRRDAGTLHNLGVAFARLGQLDDAVASFREAVALNPQSAGSYKNLGLA